MVDGLISRCATSEQRRFLQDLGMSVGIRKWSDNVLTMWEDGKEREIMKGKKSGKDQSLDNVESLGTKVISN